MGMYYLWRVDAPDSAPSPDEVANRVAPLWHADTAARVVETADGHVYFGRCRIHPPSIMNREERVARAIAKATGGVLEDKPDVMPGPLPTLPEVEAGGWLFERATAPLGKLPEPKRGSMRAGASHHDGFSVKLDTDYGKLTLDAHKDAPRRFYRWVVTRAEGVSTRLLYPFPGYGETHRVGSRGGVSIAVSAYDVTSEVRARLVRPDSGASLQDDPDEPVAALASAGITLASWSLTQNQASLRLEAESVPSTVAWVAEIDVDGSYVAMHTLAFVDAGESITTTLEIPVDDEGGDELAIVLYALQLESADTARLVHPGKLP